MEAYNVKRGTRVIITDDDIKTAPSSLEVIKGDVIKISGLDGMYCHGTDKDGNCVYIAAWTEVKCII